MAESARWNWTAWSLPAGCRAVAEPDVKKRLTDMGLTVGFATGAQLGEREKAYRTSWTKIIQTSGFKPL